MPLFKKNKQTTTAIPELQEYYASKNKENAGRAWLLAFGSLLLTSAVIVGLFLGGRWLYRTVTKEDTPTTQVATTPNEEVKKPEGTTSPAEPSEDVTVNDGSASSNLLNGTNQATKPQQGVSPNQTQQQNTQAQAATTNIPSTGPTQTVALFVVVTVAGTFIYRRYLLNK